MSTEKNWSAAQLAIFDAVRNGSGHLVIEALAGTGKTTTIVAALQYVAAGLTVLMCAFNKKIEQELAKRVPNGVTVKTLHALGYAAVRRAFGHVKIDDKKTRGIMDTCLPKSVTGENRSHIAKLVGLSKNLWARTPGDIRAIAAQYGIASDTMSDDDLVAWTVEILKASKNQTKVIDFDDMIWLPCALNLSFPKYDIVFVDETQDLNACQLHIAQQACATSGRIVAVGDRNQAIYGFRGADSDGMGKMITTLNATVLPLSITYRCPKSVVSIANQIVPEYAAADSAPEGTVNTRSYNEMIAQAQPGNFILSRKNAPLLRICLALLANGTRATVQGRDIGKTLETLVKKSKAKDIASLCVWLTAYEAKEIARLTAKGAEDQIDLVSDRVACIFALTDGCDSIGQLLGCLATLFADDGGPRVICSSVHRSKGLEASQVYVLTDTFRVGQNQEESNLWYVAVTRAMDTLTMVDASNN